jgi:hypothetical protein
VRMGGYASPTPVPVFPPPPPEYAGPDSAASHVWWGGAVATDPNLAFSTDWNPRPSPCTMYTSALRHLYYPVHLMMHCRASSVAY